MNPEDARKMVTGHSAGNLTPDERRALYQAAFEDQETFDLLMQEEEFRRALEEPGTRHRFVAALREGSATPWEKVTAWFRNPAALSLAGTLAAGLLLGVFIARHGAVGPTLQPPDDPYVTKGFPITGADEAETALAKGAFSLPRQANIAVRLSLNKPGRTPEYARGEPLQLTFETGTEAQVLIFEQKPDGGVTRLYPVGMKSQVTPGGQALTVPAAGETLPVEGPAGLHRVRVVALPAGADPLTDAPDWRRVDGRAGVAEVQFRVAE